MRSLIIFFFFIGVIFIMMGERHNICTPPRVEYRYIPRTFEQEQVDKVPILSTYGDLFTKATPWEMSVGYPSIFYNKKENF